MKTLRLASASEVRARLLRAAAVRFDIDPPHIDEGDLKRSLLVHGCGPGAVAESLAQRKALTIAARKEDAVVIGADQVLGLDDELIDKAPSMAAARAQLERLRGREHVLYTAVALAVHDTVLWRYCAESHLWMRPFSDEFLDTYLASEGESVLESVGCYRFEGMGIQLFDRYAGDYFSILGLPLVPLLTALRERGLLES